MFFLTLLLSQMSQGCIPEVMPAKTSSFTIPSSSACCKTSSEMWAAALSPIIPIFFPGYKAFTHESYFLASILSIPWLFWKQTLLGPSYYLSHCLLKRPSVAPSNIRKGVKNKELKSSIPSIPVRPFFSLVSSVKANSFRTHRST